MFLKIIISSTKFEEIEGSSENVFKNNYFFN